MSGYLCKMDGRLVKVIFTLTFLFFAVHFAHKKTSSFENESSVWCSRDITGNKMCKFKNIIFNGSSQIFEFNHGSSSAVSGLHDDKDWQSIQLSSVHNHNLFYANMAIHSSTKNVDFYCDKVIHRAFVFARFKPDNLMHVIHDDILPLFMTLESICGGDWETCAKDFYLFAVDKNDYSHYSFLYEIFTNNFVLLHNKQFNICFRELYMGFNLQSIWYQYGFIKPRGPLPVTMFHSDILKRFKNHLLSALSIKPVMYNKYAVILKRTNSRRLVNSEEIARVLHEIRDVSDIAIIDVTTENTNLLLSYIINAELIVGMHGAEMILNIFANSNATVVEIFPYGISANLVSFLQPLSKMKSRPFRYFNWTNDNRNNSIRYPDNPPQLGGISHLSKAEISDIERLQSIDSVRCCDDPAFLSFMYQDTAVGDTFYSFLLSLPDAFEESSGLTHPAWYFPSKIPAVSCTLTDSEIFVTWQAPENVRQISVNYNVLVKINDDSVEYLTPETSLVIRKPASSASVWISAIVENVEGPDSYVSCVHKIN